MRLLEYQGKEFFKKYGIPTPKGSRATKKDDVQDAFEAVNNGHGVVLKAQVPSGGRRKVGGVKIARSQEECQRVFDELYGQKMNGYLTSELLIEERIPVQEEFYLSISVGSELGQPILLISSKGGINVEEIARNSPQYLAKDEIDIAYGLLDYQVRNLVSRLGIPRSFHSSFIEIASSLYKFFAEYEATLAEINPLALDEKGKFRALNSRIEIDDAAIFRQAEIKKVRDAREKTQEEYLREEVQLEFVALDGNIGLVSGGAGMTMTAMDLISHEGGKPACFMDCSANVSPIGFETALRTVTAMEGVTSILINIFGGLTRMDHVGEYLVEALTKIGGIKQPLTIRLEGTEAEKGREFVRKAGFSPVDTFQEAVKRAVALGGRQ